MIILFQNIWSNLKKEPLVSLLFILQIAITAFVIFVTCFEVKYNSDVLDTVNTTYSDYIFYALREKLSLMSDDELNDFMFGNNKAQVTERLDLIVEEIRDIDGVKLAVNQYSDALQVFDGLSHFEPADKNPNNNNALVFSATESNSQWKHCQMDKAFFDLFPVRLDSGRFFTDEEFELTYEAGSTVPVLLGYEFKKYYKIGDVLETYLNSNITTYRDSSKEDYVVYAEVIGFIAEDETWVSEVGSSLATYNDRIVSPYNYRRLYDYTETLKPDGTFRSNSMFASGVRGMYFLVDSDNEAEIRNKMNQVLEKYDLDGKFYFGKYLGSTATVVNNYKENSNIRLALTYITVAFAFVSIVLLTVNRITANIRNYAIHLISGGTYGNIYMYVVGEITVYTIVGYIWGSNAYIARNIYYNYVFSMSNTSQFGFKTGWFICLIMLALFIILSLFIVIFRMNNIDLSSAIRDKIYADGGRGSVYKAVTVTAFSIISFCIVFAVSYIVYLNNIDLYYRHFYSENTKLVRIFNKPNSTATIKANYQSLGDNYVLDKFISISNYSELSPYIRATYYKGNVELPEMRSGRYFTEEELDGKTRYDIAVIGQKAYEDFAFQKDDGKYYFTYADTDYEIIGIMGRKDGTETRIDEWVFLPLNTIVYKHSYIGTYFIDGPSKADVQTANDLLIPQIEKIATVESKDQEYTEVVIGPTDSFLMLSIMIAINIIIVCIYYTDKKNYTVAVKKFIGYSKGMVFFDIFANFLLWASIGYGIGVTAVITILLTPLKDLLIFTALELNLTIILISFFATALLALIFAAIAINRTYNRDTSEVLRG